MCTSDFFMVSTFYLSNIKFVRLLTRSNQLVWLKNHSMTVHIYGQLKRNIGAQENTQIGQWLMDMIGSCQWMLSNQLKKAWQSPHLPYSWYQWLWLPFRTNVLTHASSFIGEHVNWSWFQFVIGCVGLQFHLADGHSIVSSYSFAFNKHLHRK